jgi:probable HAF family extracellular repeat protein
LLATLFCAGVTAEIIYTVTDLGTLGGSARAYGINDSGVVTGYSRKDVSGIARDRAFVASGGTMTDLGVLSNGTLSQGRDINNNGLIVGFGDTTDSGTGATRHAFKYENGAMVDIHTLGSTNGSRRASFAHGVNDAGTVVGYSQTDLSETTSARAFKHENGSMSLLSSLPGGGATRAWDINSSGVIVGEAQASGLDRAVRWNADGTIDNLGTLPGGSRSFAEANSDTGIIVGSSEFSSSTDVHAFKFINGTMTDLGTLGGDRSFAHGVDDAGNVVGLTEMNPGSTLVIHAFLHDGTTMFDLNDLISENSGWVLESAEDINSSGQIIGIGSFDGETRAFLLDPISTPEPSSLVLCSAMLLAAGGWRAWRNARSGMPK